MLSQNEVYDIMRTDFLELQRKRIKELEDALQYSTKVIQEFGYSTKPGGLVDKNIALIEKGVSL